MRTKPFASVEIASRPSPDGLREMTLYSEALNRRADLTIFAPAQADSSAELPLIVLLHGVYGSHWAWSRNGRAHEVLQFLTTSGSVRPAVLAMPSDGLFGIGSGYLARPEENVDQWITQEVPLAVQLLYPNAGQSGVAIGGLSMGGWGALRLTARHPGVYCAAVALSPLTRLAQVAGYARDHHAHHSPPVSDPDLLTLMIDQRRHLPPIRIACGQQDPLISDVRILHDGLIAADLPHDYGESDGRHDWDYWAGELNQTFTFINQYL